MKRSAVPLVPADRRIARRVTTPIVDPRDGDLEDDVSSTKRRSFLSLAGSLLAEISFAKLTIVWLLLIGLPALLLGAAPLLVSIWITSVLSKARIMYADVWPVLLLLALAALGWFGGRRLLRLAETSFWSLNALAVQPAYILSREAFLHLADGLISPRLKKNRRYAVRAGAAAASGFAICGLGVALIVLAWPASRWTGSLADLTAPLRLLPVLLANSIVLLSGYFAVAALVWSVADTTMDQPRNLEAFAVAPRDGRSWRIAHLSDIHVVGERYGFRVESGRSGPRGNDRFRQVLAYLDEIHTARRLDAILMTGDLTDAGRSAEWAELFACLTSYPRPWLRCPATTMSTWWTGQALPGSSCRVARQSGSVRSGPCPRWACCRAPGSGLSRPAPVGWDPP